jgi:hypothetical protein
MMLRCHGTLTRFSSRAIIYYSYEMAKKLEIRKVWAGGQTLYTEL